MRLLAPVSFGASWISAANALPTDMRAEGGYSRVTVYQPVKAEGGTDYSVETPLSGAGAQTADRTYLVPRETRGMTLYPVWYGGMAAVGLWFLISNLRFAAKLRKTRQKLDVPQCPIPVYVSAAADTPCLFGLFRPAVYLTPEAAADDVLLRHSVEHETAHFRHGDHVWAVLRGVCLGLHWYNPLVWWAAFLSRRDGELACDEAAIARLGEGERAEYGRTLIAMTCRKRTALLVAATTMTGSKSGLRERVTLIAKKPKMAACTLAAVILVAAVAAGCTFTGAADELPTEGPVNFFSGDGIVSMTLTDDAGNTVSVGDEHLEEMAGWVGSFSRGDPVSGAEEPGLNAYSVTAYRADGSSQTSGIDVTEYEGAEYYVSRPDLPACWYDIWEARETLDVVAAMAAVRAEDFTNPGYYGNVAAEQLAAALNEAASHKTAETEGVYYWAVEDAYLEGGPDLWAGTDRHFSIYCGLDENVVMVHLSEDNKRDTAYFDAPALYQLVRHSGDYDETVDAAAYEKFKDLLLPQMESSLAAMTQDAGLFTGYELTRFALAWDYEEADGGHVELYYFNYALLTPDPAKVVWAGGMRLDSKLRVQGFYTGAGGQLAVRYKDGETVGAVFMGGDFFYTPEYTADAQWAKDRITAALDEAQTD